MATREGLALVGYGKMGRLIDQLAPEFGFEVRLRLDAKNNKAGDAITAGNFKDIRAAIEFSNPEAAPENLRRLGALSIATVTGTTGWLAQLDPVSKAFVDGDAGLVWGPNFSIGAAVFRRLVERAAELLKSEPEYGAWGWEIHHDTKKDAPSGTLVHLVKAMHDAGYERRIDTGSNRAGKHPGTHEIGFDSAADTITLRHAARSREGFARGALKAAQWIADRKGVHTFEEVLFGSAGLMK